VSNPALQGRERLHIYNKSEIVLKQLDADNKFFNLKLDINDLMNFIDNKLKIAYDNFINATIPTDDIPSINNDKIIYKGLEYQDIAYLAKNNPEYISYALALNIRYTYIHLESHGLAREYKEMGFNPDDACEGFASAFNHYFNTFCSAFPDLEKPFGSIGSFFNQTLDSWNKYIVFVNPPFDENLMDTIFEQIIRFLKEADQRRSSNPSDTTGQLLASDHHYILTVPNWTDWIGLHDFKQNMWTYMTGIYLKGSLPFINHMDNMNKQIYPADIAELFCRSPLK
jgi:hypothetical protein